MYIKFFHKITFFFLLSISSYSYASHIVSGDMSYTYLGSNSYEFTITYYRDCSSDGADFDFNTYFTVRYSDGGGLFVDYSDTLDEENIHSVPLADHYSIPCVMLPEDTCIDYTTYSKIIYLPPTIGGYTVAHQRCCFPDIMNVMEAEFFGTTNSCHVPGSETLAFENNSPQFLIHSPFVVCNNMLTSFDHSAYDADGDSLSYYLTNPIKGASSLFPHPTITSSPPYSPFDWIDGHSTLDPLGEAGVITINETSGMLDIYPTRLGKYLFAVKVKEYRDGELISEKVRNILLNVIGDSGMGNTKNFVKASDENFYIYPNPVTTSFSIKTNGQIDTILIYNTSGDLIKKSIQTTEINIEGLARGLYFVILMTEDDYTVKKIEKY